MDSNGWPARLVRLGVAAALLLYGLAKLPLPGHVPQFIYSRDWTFDARTGHPATLVWHFFGYAPAYGYTIAFTEILAAVLLVVPRTRTVGALLAFGMLANIAVMDVTFGFPVPATVLAVTLALASFALLVADRERIQGLLGAPTPGSATRRANEPAGAAPCSATPCSVAPCSTTPSSATPRSATPCTAAPAAARGDCSAAGACPSSGTAACTARPAPVRAPTPCGGQGPSACCGTGGCDA